MRLNADVLLRAENYLNAVNDRELNLRGLKVSAIENLAVLQDQFDVIDFSDNDIRKIDNFPVMNRITMLLFSNNSITRIASNLHEYLPNLQHLILTNNKISTFAELQHLSFIKSLQHLSLLENPIGYLTRYRSYAVYALPQLKSLDFVKISTKERADAKAFFDSTEGKLFLQQINHSVTTKDTADKGVIPASVKDMSAPTADNVALPPPPALPLFTLTDTQKQEIREAISKAISKAEIDTIEQQLRTGTFPFKVTDDISVGSKRGRPEEQVNIADEEREQKTSSGHEVLAL